MELKTNGVPTIGMEAKNSKDIMKQKTLFIISILFISFSVFSQNNYTNQQTLGPENGNLLIIGGGRLDSLFFKKFKELAGGDKAIIVIIPTALPETMY